MVQLKGGIYITAKEISLITGLHVKTCYKEHLAIRDALGIKSKHLTLRQFCEYNLFDQEEIIIHLNQFR